jgi:hypothetical protein
MNFIPMEKKMSLHLFQNQNSVGDGKRDAEFSFSFDTPETSMAHACEWYSSNVIIFDPAPFVDFETADHQKSSHTIARRSNDDQDPSNRRCHLRLRYTLRHRIFDASRSRTIHPFPPVLGGRARTITTPVLPTRMFSGRSTSASTTIPFP